MKQDQMQFANACIFDKMIWPEDNAWIYELIKEAKEKASLNHPVDKSPLTDTL